MTAVAVMIAAQAVAMRAMIGDLDQHAVDDMLTLAEELPCGQAMFRSVTGFVTQYELIRHDPEALAAEGRVLRDAILAAAGVSAGRVLEFPERRDIDG